MRPGLKVLQHPVVSLGDAEKAYNAALLAIPMLPENMRHEISALLTLESAAMIGGTALALAASHAIGVGFAVDVLIAGVGVVCFGAEAFRAGREFHLFWITATAAQSEDTLKKAAVHFAAAVSIVGVNAVVIILARKTDKVRYKGDVLARWTHVSNDVKFGRIRNGTLWSRLGEKGEIAAAKLARSDGSVTLEMLLKKLGLREPLDRDLAGLNRESSGRIWEMLSRKYAESLEGNVIAYIDDASLKRAVSDKTLSSQTLKLSAAEFRDHKALPQLTAELETIADLMNRNNAIHNVTLKNVYGKTLYTMTRQMARNSSRLTH